MNKSLNYVYIVAIEISRVISKVMQEAQKPFSGNTTLLRAYIYNLSVSVRAYDLDEGVLKDSREIDPLTLCFVVEPPWYSAILLY